MTPNITSPDEYFNYFTHKYVCLKKQKAGLSSQHRMLPSQIPMLCYLKQMHT